MGALVTKTTQLPDTLEDLTQFVLVGKAKLQAYMIKLQTVNKLSVAQEIRDQTLKEAQEVSTALIAAEQRIGELLLAIPKASGGDRKSEDFKNRDGSNFEKSKSETISTMGYSKDEASDYQRMAKNPEVVQRVIEEAIANGQVVTKTRVLAEIKALTDELTAQDKKIRELINNPTIEIRPPSDYQQTKAKADAYDRETARLNRKLQEAYDQRNELQDRVSELERATNEGLESASLSENIFYFCAISNNFISNVGGLVWLTERICDMPPKEKEMFLKAARAFRDFGLAFTQNLEKGVAEDERKTRNHLGLPARIDS